MTFVDANVIMYAVGRPHLLKSRAREFFDESWSNRKPLFTSAAVIQELMHVYLRRNRPHILDAALDLVASAGVEVWPLEEADTILARQLHESHPRWRRETFATWRAAGEGASERS